MNFARTTENQIDGYKRTLLRYYNIYLTSNNDEFAEGMAEACRGCLDQIEHLQSKLRDYIECTFN